LALVLAALLSAAPSLELADAGGTVHRLADYRGKVVLLNFWASWCEPCLEELPAIERLRSSLADRGFVVLAVEMGGSARTARAMAHKLGLTFPVLPDRDSSVTKAWGVRLLPASFLVGRDGRVAFSHSGELDWSSAPERRRVEKLLRQQ